MNGSSSSGGSLLGIFILLGAVISAAVFNILSRKFSENFTPMELTYAMMEMGNELLYKKWPSTARVHK